MRLPVDLKEMPIKCPGCGTLTKSLKSYRLIDFLLFIGIYGGARHVTVTACPDCMRREILKRTFSWSILTGNVIWLIAGLPYHLALLIANTTKGHSKRVIEHMESSLRSRLDR
jgi:hypothetical protein